MGMGPEREPREPNRERTRAGQPNGAGGPPRPGSARFSDPRASAAPSSRPGGPGGPGVPRRSGPPANGARRPGNGAGGGGGFIRPPIANGGPGDGGDQRDSGRRSAPQYGAPGPRSRPGDTPTRGTRGGPPDYSGPSRAARGPDSAYNPAERSPRRSMADMARDVSRTMSRQLSSVVARAGRAMRRFEDNGDSARMPAPMPPRPRMTPPPASTLPLRALPYRRSRSRLLARKWRMGRVRANPIMYFAFILLSAVVAVAVAFGGGLGGAYAYNYYGGHVGEIQAIANLKNHASSVILDRNGQELAVIKDDSGFNYYVPKSQISSKLQWTTIDLEDHSFYSNIGVDFVGTLRAALSDVSGGTTQGGSTITQQLVKNIVAKDSTVSLTRKINEAILAYGVTQQFDKAQILEMYLNTIPYGDSNEGIEAAAKNFFGLQPSTDAKGEVTTANMKLSWAQAALLAGLPNAPTLYLPIQYSCSKAPCPQDKWDNPFQNPSAPCGPHIPTFGPEWYLTHGHEWLDYCRAREALDAVKQYGVNDGSASFTDADYAQADADLVDMLVQQKIYHWKAYNDAGASVKNATSVKAPHFVDYVVQQMANDFGITDLGNAGLTIYTTLDLNLQTVAQNSIHHYIDEDYHEPWYGPYDNAPLSVASNAHNGAMVAIDQSTGDILAMVGSADYYSKDPHVLGYNNITTSKLRSMGSSTKPLVYATAFQMGWNPGVMLQDIPICYPNPAVDPATNQPIQDSDAKACKGWYVPHNYEEHDYSGRIPLRRMLDGSLNIPATETMEFVGATPDTADGFLSMAQRLGVTTISKSRMGPTTALGTQEIPLLELTGAYATFANQGKRHPLRAILRIETASGQQIYPVLPGPQVAPVGPGDQVISPQAAYMLTNVLSDNYARYPFFKPYNPLHLDPDFPNLQIAAKTGTSSGTSGPNDIVTVGYSPFLTVGVWVGNTDANDPMTPGIIGIAGAGYIFHDVMDWAAKNYKWPSDAAFPIPSGLSLGTFNCDTGLAPYKDAKPADLDCVAHPAPGFPGVNPYDPDHGINHRPDTDIYISGQAPLQS